MDGVLMRCDVRGAESEEAVTRAMSEDVAAGPSTKDTLTLRIEPTGGVEHVKWLVLSSTGRRH
jgi:hypothetical protein